MAFMNGAQTIGYEKEDWPLGVRPDSQSIPGCCIQMHETADRIEARLLFVQLNTLYAAFAGVMMTDYLLLLLVLLIFYA